MRNAAKFVIAFLSAIILISVAIATSILFYISRTSQDSPISENSKSLLPSEIKTSMNMEDKQTEELDVFSAKSDFLERLSKITPEIIEITGLKSDAAKSHAKFSEPFILSEKFGKTELNNVADISANGFPLTSADIIIIEKFISPEKTEYPILVSASWENIPSTSQLSKMNYPMWQQHQKDCASYIGSNPDGTISLFFVSSDDSSPSLELRGEVISADISITNAQITFMSSSIAEIKGVINELCNFCGLKEPIETGDWVWRRATVIPWMIKDTIDGGLVKRHVLVPKNKGVINCSAVTWNNVLISIELIVLKEEAKSILETFKDLSENTDEKFSGFSVKLEELEHATKITITDEFVLNFSTLWLQ